MSEPAQPDEGTTNAPQPTEPGSPTPTEPGTPSEPTPQEDEAGNDDAE